MRFTFVIYLTAQAFLVVGGWNVGNYIREGTDLGIGITFILFGLFCAFYAEFLKKRGF